MRKNITRTALVLSTILIAGCATQPMKTNDQGEFKTQTITFTSNTPNISCTMSKDDVELAGFTPPSKQTVTLDNTAPLDIYCAKEGYFNKRYLLEVKAAGETGLIMFGALGGAIADITKTSNGSYRDNLHIYMKKNKTTYN